MHLTHLTNRQLFKLLSSLMIGVVLIVGVLVFYNLNKTSINNELVALYLVPRPEKLTELYFNDSVNLPASATAGQEISFAFDIHNLEATDYTYAYEVSMNVNGMRHVVDSGNVLVKNNQYYIKNERFKLTHSPGRQEIVVELINKRQSIDFWVA